MRITKYIHSCLLIEEGETKILVDPGTYSFEHGGLKPEDFTGLAAIFITHSHPDHADPKALKEIVANNPGLKVYGNSETQKVLHNEGVRVEVFEMSKKQIGTIAVDALPASHEKLLVPEPVNTAYAFNKHVLVTGDSYDSRLSWFKQIPVLATPIFAPWTDQLKTVAFIKSIAPKTFLPLHDGYVKDFFHEHMTAVFAHYLTDFGIEVRSLKSGEALET